MDISSVRNSHVLVTPTPEPVSPAQQKEQRELVQAVHAINAAGMFGEDNELTFYFDRTSHKAVARIINKETGKVVRQIPTESVLRIAQEFRKG